MITLTDRHHAAATMKALRKQRGYSLGQLAYKLGAAQSTICYRERGERAFTLDVIVTTAHVLGFDLALIPARHPGARPTGTGWPA